MKKIYAYIIILLISITPSITYAYSDKVILGGNSVGINIETPGILIIGFYKIDGSYNKGTPELKVGDYITKVNDIEVNKIDELTTELEKNTNNENIIITFKRDNTERKTKLKLKLNEGVYKTGLYVKDSITGIGTLTYIDPTTKYFGALGHEIIESNTNEVVELKTGNIFKSEITNIDKSEDGNPGSKNAKYYYKEKYGTIKKNTDVGIYGTYEKDLTTEDYIEVAPISEIKTGEAEIYTVLNKDEIKKYKININKINENNKTKNIYFEITDEELLDKTGGIVQGMSGSPIVQNNRIIGAVTHVIIDDVDKGYGVFITTMLEEGEKK